MRPLPSRDAEACPDGPRELPGPRLRRADDSARAGTPHLHIYIYILYVHIILYIIHIYYRASAPPRGPFASSAPPPSPPLRPFGRKHVNEEMFRGSHLSNTTCLRPVHLLRVSLLRVLESNFPGDSL